MTQNIDVPPASACIVFFFNDPATTEIYSLSLHDALPIFSEALRFGIVGINDINPTAAAAPFGGVGSSGLMSLMPTKIGRHTSELQSLAYVVCRLLLEKNNVGSNQLVEADGGQYALPHHSS